MSFSMSCFQNTMMEAFADVLIYAGKQKITATSRLLLLKSSFFRGIFDSIQICDGCDGKMSIIFPEEDENDATLYDTFSCISLMSRYPKIEGTYKKFDHKKSIQKSSSPRF